MLARQFVIFVAVGLVSALVDTALMQVLLWQGTSVWLAVTVGFSTGLVVNYVSHSRITFGAALTWQRGLRFGTIVAFNFLLTLAFVHAAEALVGNALLGKVVSLPFVAAAGFAASRIWVFR